MVSLGERMVDEATAIAIVATWLETPFEGGRHERRIAMIDGPAE
jgi:ribose 5-phosphate isomerase B